MLTKSKPKTIKQKKFLAELIKTGNATEAATRAYQLTNRNSARNIGAQNVAKLCISDMLEAHGLTENALLKTLSEAMKASKIATNGKRVPDWNARLKSLEIALKLTNLESKIIQSNNTTQDSSMEIDLNDPKGIERIMDYHQLQYWYYGYLKGELSSKKVGNNANQLDFDEELMI